MPIYKILQFDNRRTSDLEGMVEGRFHGLNEWERWGSLEEALNELAQAGWEIDETIYGPVPGGDHQGDSWIVALVLINKTSDMNREVERQIRIVERNMEIAKNETNCPNKNDIEKISAKQYLNLQSNIRDALINKLNSLKSD